VTSAETTRIAVGGERPYEVLVGHGLLAGLPPLIGDKAQTVALVHAAGLAGPARAAGRVDGSAHRGIVGMRERAQLLGGTLDAGPLPGGGFRVRADLPLEPAA